MHRLIHLMLLLALLTACTPAQTETSAPISDAPLITPVESAFAPNDPTAAPLEDILASHTVTFETPDAATLTC